MPNGEAAARERPAGQTGLPWLRRQLLRLIAPDAAIACTDIALSATQWTSIDRLAASHRVQPLLGWLHRDNPCVPEDVRRIWQESRRVAAAEALLIRRELAGAVRLLEASGIASVALKGAWLAWHAYPDPSLRPMRDIDLLLPEGSGLSGFQALLAAGYRTDGTCTVPDQDAARLSKHLPPLISPAGICVELHQRLAEPPGRMDHRSPAAPLADAITRTIIVDGIRYLDPTDLVAHLAIHAVYDHRLDCGPLVLTDVAYATSAAPIDWARLWADARAQGWERGARLILELVQAFAPSCAVEFPEGQAAAPASLKAIAADLLLQELTTRQSAGVLAATLAGGWQGLMRRMLPIRSLQGESHPFTTSATQGGYFSWAASRVTRTARDLARRDVRRQSAGLAALSGWLDGHH